MRKVAAHYYLRPDGSVGKFPVVVFDESNRVVEVRERVSFVEEPFMELVNGFLMPGFVQCIPHEVLNLGDDDVKGFVKQRMMEGTKAFGVGRLNSLSDGLSAIQGVSFFEVECKMSGVENFTLSFLKEKKAGLEKLQQYTRGNAEVIGVSDEFGVLKVGAMPGLLAISKMNYNDFTLSCESKVRIII